MKMTAEGNGRKTGKADDIDAKQIELQEPLMMAGSRSKPESGKGHAEDEPDLSKFVSRYQSLMWKDELLFFHTPKCRVWNSHKII